MNTTDNPRPSPSEAGWYPDPAGVWTWRWFDGSDWTATVNDGQTNHSDVASLMARSDPAATAAAAAAGPEGLPPPTSPVEAASSTGRRVMRIIGWGAGAVVAVFALLVVIGLVVGDDDHKPVASVEGAEVFASISGTADRTDANWFVVVEPGTSVAELEEITRSLLALPEAQGLRLSGQFLNSSDELEGYVELNRLLLGDIDAGQISEDAGDFDIDVIVQNTIGFLDWSDSTESHIVCPADAVTCNDDLAVATIPRSDVSG